MNIIYIKETEETCDIIKRIIVRIKKILNIVRSHSDNGITIYYLPIFKDIKISKHTVKRLANKTKRMLEKDNSNTIVLSDYLYNKQLLKTLLYAENINILDGRYLFKCLIHKILEYIFKIKNRTMEFRRGFIVS